MKSIVVKNDHGTATGHGLQQDDDHAHQNDDAIVHQTIATVIAIKPINKCLCSFFFVYNYVSVSMQMDITLGFYVQRFDVRELDSLMIRIGYPNYSLLRIVSTLLNLSDRWGTL